MKALFLVFLMSGSTTLVWAGNAPSVYFGSIMQQNGRPTIEATNEFSRSHHESMCWLIHNAPKHATFKIIEQFRSPPNSIFEHPKAQIQVNANATEHTLTYNAQTNQAGQFLQCWSFDSSDPVGMYTLTLTINNKKIQPQTFQLKY